MPLGQLMMLVDSVIVLVGFIAFGDWKYTPLFMDYHICDGQNY
jgi:hypothetical protein